MKVIYDLIHVFESEIGILPAEKGKILNGR